MKHICYFKKTLLYSSTNVRFMWYVTIIAFYQSKARLRKNHCFIVFAFMARWSPCVCMQIIKWYGRQYVLFFCRPVETWVWEPLLFAWLFNLVFCFLPSCICTGTGSLPSDWSEQGGEGVPPDYQELVRERDVWPRQSQTGFGQSGIAEHERPRQQPGRSRRWWSRRHWGRGESWEFHFYGLFWMTNED